MTGAIGVRCQSLRGLVVILVLLLVPFAARADKAKDLLNKAVQHYVMVDFNKSLRVLKKARRATRDRHLLGQILLYTGCNHAELGKTARARKAFLSGLTHDPLLQMAPGRFKAAIEKLFRSVRVAARGELSVTADHKGALVMLDGKPAGMAPIKKKVGIGKHKVRMITTDGRFGLLSQVVLAPGRTTKLEARLERLQGFLSVKTKPSGATILLEGKPLGKSPLVRLRVNTGKHRLVLRLKGYRQLETPVSLAWDRESSVSQNLEPLPVPKPVSAPASLPVASVEPASQAVTVEPAAVVIARYERRTKTVHGTVALGLGGAAAITAAVLYGVARSQGDEAHEQYAAATNPNAITRHWDEVEATEAKANVSGVLLGVAAVCLGYGLYQLLSRPEVPAGQRATDGATVGVVPPGRGAGAVLGGTF